MADDVGIGGRLKELRQRAGMTQEGVARDVGVSSITISRYERGVVESPDSDVLSRLARLYGSTVDWILGGEAPEESRVEVERPASFEAWLANMAPPNLSEQVIERMLATHFRFPPEDAYRWGQVYDLVMADIRGRRSKGELAAEEAATADAEKAADRAGLRRPKPRKKR